MNRYAKISHNSFPAGGDSVAKYAKLAKYANNCVSRTMNCHMYTNTHIDHEIPPAGDDAIVIHAKCASDSSQNCLSVENDNFAEKNHEIEAIGCDENGDVDPYIVHCY